MMGRSLRALGPVALVAALSACNRKPVAWTTQLRLEAGVTVSALALHPNGTCVAGTIGDLATTRGNAWNAYVLCFDDQSSVWFVQQVDVGDLDYVGGLAVAADGTIAVTTSVESFVLGPERTHYCRTRITFFEPGGTVRWMDEREDWCSRGWSDVTASAYGGFIAAHDSEVVWLGTDGSVQARTSLEEARLTASEVEALPDGAAVVADTSTYPSEPSVALVRPDGRVVWTSAIRSAGNLVVDGEDIWASSGSRTLHRLYPEDGTIRNSFEVSGGSIEAFTVRGGEPFVALRPEGDSTSSRRVVDVLGEGGRLVHFVASGDVRISVMHARADGAIMLAGDFYGHGEGGAFAEEGVESGPNRAGFVTIVQ